MCFVGTVFWGVCLQLGGSSLRYVTVVFSCRTGLFLTTRLYMLLRIHARESRLCSRQPTPAAPSRKQLARNARLLKHVQPAIGESLPPRLK